MEKKKFSRREFLRQSGASSIAVAAIVPTAGFAGTEPVPAATVDRQAIFAAIGDTLIPADPDDPGYKSLEPYKITEEVMKGLAAIKDDDLDLFNRSCGAFFDGRQFLQLTEAERADYLRLIIDGSRFSDKTQLRVLQRVYRQTRTRVFDLFYRNFPENVIARDQNGAPVLRPGDKHQITNPNTKKVKTGWDIAGFKGQMTWEEEETARAKYKKLGWHS